MLREGEVRKKEKKEKKTSLPTVKSLPPSC